MPFTECLFFRFDPIGLSIQKNSKIQLNISDLKNSRMINQEFLRVPPFIKVATPILSRHLPNNVFEGDIERRLGAEANRYGDR